MLGIFSTRTAWATNHTLAVDGALDANKHHKIVAANNALSTIKSLHEVRIVALSTRN